VRKKFSPHLTAVLQALFVTFLWSTSWVLIKFGLQDIPPLTFAGLRYFLAFLTLLPFYLWSNQRSEIRYLAKKDWSILVALGLMFYTITQGSQFLGLVYLPAITFSLLLNGTALVVAILGIFLLREIPTWLQWTGMLIFLAGAAFFFYPFEFPSGVAFGYFIAAIHILATSLSSIMGRSVNRQKRISPLTVTIVSMGVGSIAMLAIGLLVEDPPMLDLNAWLIIGWLAIVNTAFTFTLWNHTLRTLTATESSVINNTMLIQISILAWLFLGETLSLLQTAGLLLAALGALLVQIKFGNRGRKQSVNTKPADSP
jgi:drug/metabolite transporter (DMT)-like permease